VKADLGQIDGPDKFLTQMKSLTSGELKIDILVNNAGKAVSKTLTEMTVGFYNDIFNVNVSGLVFLTKAMLPFLQPQGRIINISSIAARTGLAGNSAYGASKAAVEGLTRNFAAELGKNGTTVNAVSPGPVPSDMLDSILDKELVNSIAARTPIGNRIAVEEEVPNIVAWLASPGASWVTG